MSSWKPISYETLPWERDMESQAAIPKSRRRKILSTYEAAIPASLADKKIELPAELKTRGEDLLVSLARFDAEIKSKNYSLPALLLRSESSASSQIENLTSSARNVALAEISNTAPHNAKLIAGNIAAMQKALTLPAGLSKASILKIHAALINRDNVTYGGEFRDEQVWIGGTPYSPHGALFVPPQACRIESALDDLIQFSERTDIGAIAKAAIVHAQFETIHPFIDGNGRTGRTLLHKILKDEEVLLTSTLPVSAGLLHDIDSYMRALDAYHTGNPYKVIEQLTAALELAISIGYHAASMIDEVIEEWQEVISERTGSSIYKLTGVLIKQPVIDSATLAVALNITKRSAMTIIHRACEYGILRPLGNRQRGECYQADRILEVLDEISSIAGIRRMMAR